MQRGDLSDRCPLKLSHRLPKMIYPRRAQERGTMGYALVEFTITDTGSVENAQTIEGYCSSKRPDDPDAQFRPCSMFNSASARAALKLGFGFAIETSIPVSGAKSSSG